jgi:TetR/AcrR family tetracycline transcriptional repressor
MTANRVPGSEGAPRPRSRRPRGSLTREAVVDAALAIVDAEGVEALSMPRLARRLDAGVMTLYGYVRSKQELLDAVAMRAIAEVRVPDLDAADQRAILLSWGRGLRTVLLVHPGVAGIIARRAVIGTGIFRGVETLVGPLRREGFDAASAVRAVYAVLIYTLGFVMWETPRVHEQPPSAYAAQWREGFARLPEGAFPHVAAALPALGTLASEEQFELGLHALVTGLDLSGGSLPDLDDRLPERRTG